MNDHKDIEGMEYKTLTHGGIFFNLGDELNAHAKEGWKLTHTIDGGLLGSNTYVFIRPLEPTPEEEIPKDAYGSDFHGHNPLDL